jgi:hypothetical protein
MHKKVGYGKNAQSFQYFMEKHLWQERNFCKSKRTPRAPFVKIEISVID